MLLLALLPLVASLALIALAVPGQEHQLVEREHALVEQAYLDARRSELRNRRQALQVRTAQYTATVGLIRALGGDWGDAAPRVAAAP